MENHIYGHIAMCIYVYWLLYMYMWLLQGASVVYGIYIYVCIIFNHYKGVLISKTSTNEAIRFRSKSGSK